MVETPRPVDFEPQGAPYFTEAERQRFQRDGFVVVRGMYSAEDIDAISRWCDELAARVPVRGREMLYFEDDLLRPGARVLSRIEKFLESHDGLRAVVQAPRVVGRMSELMGEPVVLFKEKINFKMPGGGGFEPHQDIQPGWDAYASWFVSVLITIDDSTSGNGCLELAPGQHRRGMIGERWKPLSGAQLDGIEFVPYPTAPGDAVFFDCFVPHRSAPNRSAGPRRNLYLTFNRRSEGDSRERYFVDKRASYPPDNEREPGKEYRFRV